MYPSVQLLLAPDLALHPDLGFEVVTIVLVCCWRLNFMPNSTPKENTVLHRAAISDGCKLYKELTAAGVDLFNPVSDFRLLYRGLPTLPIPNKGGGGPMW